MCNLATIEDSMICSDGSTTCSRQCNQTISIIFDKIADTIWEYAKYLLQTVTYAIPNNDIYCIFILFHSFHVFQTTSQTHTALRFSRSELVSMLKTKKQLFVFTLQLHYNFSTLNTVVLRSIRECEHIRSTPSWHLSFYMLHNKFSTNLLHSCSSNIASILHTSF